MSLSFKVVIPARYASTRLPAKPLADIGGQPMVVRVMQRAQLAGADEVWVATDRAEVAQAVEAAGGKFVMTSPDHPSGTDRLAEVVDLLAWSDETIIVNVQGDEPLIEPAIIARVARLLASHREAAMATAAHAIDSFEEFLSPAVVKVVCDAAGRGTYFSRAPIPYPRDLFVAGMPASGSLPVGLKAARHVGLYAYRASFLRAYAKLRPVPYENIEMLEQLRALWHGFEIYVELLEQAPPGGVDTAEDLERVRKLYAAHLNTL